MKRRPRIRRAPDLIVSLRGGAIRFSPRVLSTTIVMGAGLLPYKGYVDAVEGFLYLRPSGRMEEKGAPISEGRTRTT